MLNDGTRKVEFHYFGWAHTRGDGFVYLPKEQVLCTGDAVVNGAVQLHRRRQHAGNWPNVIRAAAKLKVKYVLPGHGEPGGKEMLAGQEQFMVELHKAVKAAVDQGKTAQEIAAGLKLPEAVQGRVGGGLPTQVKDTYRQIKPVAAQAGRKICSSPPSCFGSPA